MYVCTTQNTKRGEHSATRLEPITFLIPLNYLQDGPDHGVHIVVQLAGGVERSSLFPGQRAMSTDSCTTNNSGTS